MCVFLPTRSVGSLLLCTGEELTGLSDTEHFDPADWAYTPSCRATVFHRDLFRVFHL